MNTMSFSIIVIRFVYCCQVWT